MNKAEVINSLKSDVRFVADGHRYFLGEEQVKYTLTQILRMFNISPDYSDVPKHILEKAASRGTMIHEILETYDNYLELPPVIITEIVPLIRDYVSKKQDVLVSEFAVSYDTILATKIDKIIYDNNTGEVIVADVKVTAQPHIESVQYQCSFGAYMLYKTTGIKADKGRLIWLNKKTDKCELQDFNLIPFEELDKFIDALKNDDFKPYQLVESPGNVLQLNKDVIKEIQDLIKQEQEVKDKLKSLKENLKELMREKGVKQAKFDGLLMTYVLPTTKQTFDLEKFKKEHKDIDFSKYYKKSKTTDSIRITAQKD